MLTSLIYKSNTNWAIKLHFQILINLISSTFGRCLGCLQPLGLQFKIYEAETFTIAYTYIYDKCINKKSQY